MQTTWIKRRILPAFRLNDPPAVGSSRQVSLLEDAVCCRTKCMESKPFDLSPSNSPLNPSSRSRKTEEVASRNSSLLLWRFCRWELGPQRLWISASPRIGDTTWARHRCSQPRCHSCKEKREVRLHRRHLSSWCLSRVQPSEQKSYPRASLVLL